MKEQNKYKQARSTLRDLINPGLIGLLIIAGIIIAIAEAVCKYR